MGICADKHLQYPATPLGLAGAGDKGGHMGRWRLVLAGAALAVVSLPGAGAPATESGDMALGGGQVVFDAQTADPDGPGTTIAFTARQVPGDDFAAEGEVQEVDRSAALQG